ncbi:MAG TPA: L,D-transpeptidase family protein [Planctomycetota bacterium]|nr:L,D-transpeptidase family protein [Planctomycetota bacterium]
MAGLLWWAYGPKSAGATDGAGGAPPANAAGTVPLDQILPGEVAPKAPSAAGPLASNAPAQAAALAPADLDELLAHVAQREPAAVAAGWSLLLQARLGQQRNRLAAALEPPGNDFPALLSALGDDNSFLHSAEGRAAATKALTAAMALPDAEAVPAGSRLIGVCLKGRIERGDREQRAFVDEAYRQHMIRVERWLCDPANVTGARTYTVVSGDSLARIASRFRREKVLVEDGTLAVLNRIHNPNALQVDQKIKVPVDPIYAVVEKRSFSMAVYVGDQLLRLYWIGHGTDDRTPVTEFTVAEKQPRPQWTAPDGQVYPYGHPGNILGEYFIKFRHDSYTGFGAHGTPMPETIGTMSSAGCIRMFAADIEDLFKILPRGAKVIVRASESLR